jgi:hypothetical protein
MAPAAAKATPFVEPRSGHSFERQFLDTHSAVS